MTDLAAATADTTSLPDYGGRHVARTTISIRNAGDGLSEGIGIDPKVLPLGETVYVVLECVVHAHDHDRLMDRKSDTGLLVLDQVLKAGTGVLMDGAVVRDAIAAEAERIRVAREAAAGIQRLPMDGEAGGDDTAGDGDATPTEPTPIAGRGKAKGKG